MCIYVALLVGSYCVLFCFSSPVGLMDLEWRRVA